MRSTIESAFAAAHVQERMRQAEASRAARAAQRETPAGTRGRRWFRRSHAAAAKRRPLHLGR